MTAPNGNSLAEFRQNLLAGVAGVERMEIRYMGEQLAGVCHYDPLKYQKKKEVRVGTRAGSLARRGDAWLVDEQPFDRVVLACSALEAARLARQAQPQWSDAAAAFEYEPIVTVYVRSAGTRLPHPMVALRATG